MPTDWLTTDWTQSPYWEVSSTLQLEGSTPQLEGSTSVGGAENSSGEKEPGTRVDTDA